MIPESIDTASYPASPMRGDDFYVTGASQDAGSISITNAAGVTREIICPAVADTTMEMKDNSGVIRDVPVVNVGQTSIPLEIIQAIEEQAFGDIGQEIDEEDSEEEDSETDNSALAESKDDPNNYIKIIKRSPTLDMTFEQLLAGIVKFSQNVFAQQLGTREAERTFGHNVVYSCGSRYKKIWINSIGFEVGHVTYRGIFIQENNENFDDYNDQERYNITLHYVPGMENLHSYRGRECVLSVYGPTLEEALKCSVKRMQELRRCYTCNTVYDSAIGEYCVCCMFSDFYTRDNDLITCIICTEKTRDYITLKCGHRYHSNCLVGVQGHKCPMCRQVFSL